MQTKNTVLAFLAITLVPATAAAQDAPSEETIDYFSRNCTSCHTIGGGKLTGPDLKGLHERRDSAWVVGFLGDPKGTIDAGGDYERELLAAARGTYMPPAPRMTKALAGKLFVLIEQESAKEKSLFAGIQISDRPLTAADVSDGRELFLGQRRFENGGPSCVACHNTASLSGLGGGILGPDLTAAYARLEGRTALSAWLSAPPSATMQPIFASKGLEGEEVLALVAFLQEEARSGVAEGERRTLPFFLGGLFVAAGMLVLFDFVWRRRFRGVRRPLVHTLHEGREA